MRSRPEPSSQSSSCAEACATYPCAVLSRLDLRPTLVRHLSPCTRLWSGGVRWAARIVRHDSSPIPQSSDDIRRWPMLGTRSVATGCCGPGHRPPSACSMPSAVRPAPSCQERSPVAEILPASWLAARGVAIRYVPSSGRARRWQGASTGPRQIALGQTVVGVPRPGADEYQISERDGDREGWRRRWRRAVRRVRRVRPERRVGVPATR